MLNVYNRLVMNRLVRKIIFCFLLLYLSCSREGNWRSPKLEGQVFFSNSTKFVSGNKVEEYLLKKVASKKVI